ncbi:hypothetical protein DFJ73DRAFT_842630 [Zopfochytrium polystomum]|nr:hypothetical protein DFJ73DRAFT_842630 [Zopfochytrium polystomum]
MTFWDMPPPGYEGMSVDQVKATGHFPLPGQVAKPAASVFTMNSLYGAADAFKSMMPSTIVPPAAAVAQPTNIARQARRLYVGSIPVGASEEALMAFFNQTVISMGMSEGSNVTPVIAVQINHEKNYAFVEFRTPEEATAAMGLDGLNYGGQILKIRRPKDYQPPTGADASGAAVVPGVVSTQVPDSPFKLFIGGLPSYLNEEQVMELLKSFGDLKAFNLVKDSTTGISKGFAFCEYLNPVITDIACHGLNGMELDDKKLVVQRASIGANKTPVAPMAFAPSLLTSSFLGIGNGSNDPTNILLLLNMVTPEELVDDDEYNEILEDVRDECSKFGQVIKVVIPRAVEGSANENLGKVFVEFEEAHACEAALKALAGRKFADRTVFTSYVDEATYAGVQ